MTERRIPWWELVEGDQLKSVKTGKFYEVESVLALNTNPTSYRIRLAGIKNPISRPTDAEPEAIVKRGPTGQAVDVWIEVLSSGLR